MARVLTRESWQKLVKRNEHGKFVLSEEGKNARLEAAGLEKLRRLKLFDELHKKIPMQSAPQDLIQSFLTNRFKSVAGKRVLEIGGGNGSYANYLEQKGAIVSNIDPKSHNGKNIVLKRNPGKKAESINDEVENLEKYIKNGECDVVLLSRVFEAASGLAPLHHTYVNGKLESREFFPQERVDRILGLINSKLKKGGLVLTAVLGSPTVFKQDFERNGFKAMQFNFPKNHEQLIVAQKR